MQCEFGKLNGHGKRCPHTATETDFYGHHWCALHGEQFDAYEKHHPQDETLPPIVTREPAFRLAACPSSKP